MEISPERFFRHYCDVIRMAENYGVERCYLLGTSRVDEEVVFDYKPDKCHTNKGAELIDKEICRAALESGSVYVPIAQLISATTDAPTLSDGLHPNNAGHQLIADAVFNSMSDHGDV